MISPRLSRRIAQIHKWLGLIVFAQLVVWTATGLFFVAFHISDVRGEKLVHPPGHQTPIDLSRVKFTSADALKAVTEDAPFDVTLKALAGAPVYEVRGAIGTFLVSAESGERIVVDEPLAKRIAQAAWASDAAVQAVTEIEDAPRESGMRGGVWRVDFAGEGHPALYVSEQNGKVSAPRTDLWRTYDFLWSLHIMDYVERENFNSPWMLAAAMLALSVTLFGVALLVHRFTRGLIRKETQ